MLKNLKSKLINLFYSSSDKCECCKHIWLLASSLIISLWHEWTIHHPTKWITTQNPNTKIQYINGYKQVWPLYTFYIEMSRKVTIKIHIWVEVLDKSQGDILWGGEKLARVCVCVCVCVCMRTCMLKTSQIIYPCVFGPVDIWSSRYFNSSVKELGIFFTNHFSVKNIKMKWKLIVYSTPSIVSVIKSRRVDGCDIKHVWQMWEICTEFVR
jgi:hypothetical protein